MGRRRTTAVIAMLVLAGAAEAQPAASSRASGPASACFSPDLIEGITADDTRSAYLTVSIHDVYRLEMMGPCLNLDWPMTPKRLESKMGRGDICDGHDIVLVVGGYRCPVSAMRKLTPAEVKAWESRGRKP